MLIFVISPEKTLGTYPDTCSLTYSFMIKVQTSSKDNDSVLFYLWVYVEFHACHTRALIEIGRIFISFEANLK